MWAAAWTCAALWASLNLLLPGEGMEMTAWKRVLVEPGRFTSTVTKHNYKRPRILCGVVCAEESWCSLWCFAEPNQCQLTNLIVSASYIPTQQAGALQCYTRSRKDLAFGESVNSSANSLLTPLRASTNLVDGYYDYNIDECALVHHALPDGGYYAIDLSDVFPVSEVLLMADPSDAPYLTFHSIEVRVGVSPPPSPGVFSSFPLLGTYAGPGVTNEVVVLRTPEPLTARYVFIQMRALADFQICHLEIR